MNLFYAVAGILILVLLWRVNKKIGAILLLITVLAMLTVAAKKGMV